MQDTNPYPSTHDAIEGYFLPPIAGAQDEVLATLLAGRERIEADWTSGSYISGPGGAVCGIGSVIAGAGKRQEEDFLRYEGMMSVREYVETRLIDSAKEAIRLLNAAAITVEPEAEDYGSWIGPLECLNQDLGKDYVLRAYDLAIERRRGALVQ